MKEDNTAYYSLGEILGEIRSFGQYLRKRWWMLGLAVLAGAVLGTIYYFKQKPKYEAVTTFILEEKSAGGGGLAGLASQFGFNLGSLSSEGSIFSGDNILDILRSKKVVLEVLQTPAGDLSSQSKSLADRYLDFSGLRNKWSDKPALASVSFSYPRLPLNYLQDSALNIVYETIIKKNLSITRLNKKGTIIRVQITATDNLFCRLMADRLVGAAGKMYLTIKTATAQANIDRMQRRSDSLLALLNNKVYNSAVTQPLDLNPGMRAAAVPTEIALRDKTVVATLYTEVTKNLEASKLLLSQQTPVIQILDEPGLSLYDNKKGIAILIVVGGGVGGIIILLFLIAKCLLSSVVVK